MLRALVVLAVLLASACGGEGDGGTAALWITRDEGGTVLYEGRVDAGLTVIQALRSVADVETRYGGRYVQSVDDLEGSLDRGQDWFYFVNGYEADRGAAEYRVRAGDVVWWDFRRWLGESEVRVVVGAFPEPFLHGYAGKRRPAAVRYAPGLQERAEELARRIRADSVAPVGVAAPSEANVLRVVSGKPRFQARMRGSVAPGAPVEFVLAGDPSRYRFRYAVP